MKETKRETGELESFTEGKEEFQESTSGRQS